MKYLIILNDPAYGTEKSYNGLRLALSLCKREEVDLRVFLMADAISCGHLNQKTPQGYYNLERMIKGLAGMDVPVGACTTCMDARGMEDTHLALGVHRSSLDELTDWTIWAEKILVF
jgi:uncharacterized protein involved in oxidation of intracellular sulfur